MSNLASHFKAYVEGGLTPSVEAWTEDDAQALQSLMDDCAAHQERLEACASMESLISEANGMSRYLATQLEAYGIEGFDFDTYPESSFTELPSSVNYDVTMESLEEYKKLLIGGSIAGLLLLLSKFIKWLIGRGSDKNATPEEASSAHAKVSKETEKTLKGIESSKRDMSRAGRKAEREASKNNTSPSGKPIPTPPPLEVEGNRFVKIDPDTLFPKPPTGEDRATPETVKNKLLAEWHGQVDHFIGVGFRRTLENEKTHFNLPFLLSIIDNDLYTAMADVIAKMNQDLETLDKGFTEALVHYKDAMTDPTHVYSKGNVFLIENMLGPYHKGDKTQHDFAYGTRAKSGLMQGFIEADALIREYNQVLASHAQLDYVPLARYSTAFKMYDVQANPSTVVSEVFSSIRSVQDTKIRYTGESIKMPDRFLSRLQAWLEVQNKAATTRDDMKRVVTYKFFLKNVQKTITQLTSTYSGLVKIITTHNVEIRRSKKFIDGVVKNYNDIVKEYTKERFAQFGYPDLSECRSEYDEVVKVLSLST